VVQAPRPGRTVQPICPLPACGERDPGNWTLSVFAHPNRASEITMLTILLIIIIVLLLTGGGFGYSRRGRRL
jgi:hypothetical protein